MKKRYGRNQKRKHKEAIELLASEVARLSVIASRAESKARSAYSDAVSDLLRSKEIIEIAIADISFGAGKVLGKELNEHKDQILRMIGIEPVFHLEEDFRDRTSVMRIELPSKTIHYTTLLVKE